MTACYFDLWYFIDHAMSVATICVSKCVQNTIPAAAGAHVHFVLLSSSGLSRNCWVAFKLLGWALEAIVHCSPSSS